MDLDSDAELMVRVAKGDKKAFAVLFDRHQQTVFRFAHKFVGDGARAEELAQEIFVKIYRSASSYKPTAQFKTFLFRVASNHCLNELRRGEYRALRAQAQEGAEDPVALLPSQAPSPDGALWGKQLERAVGEALSRLSERERLAFSLCRFEGLAYREIALVLSASEAAIKSLIHRASLSVAQHLQELEAGAPPQRSRA